MSLTLIAVIHLRMRTMPYVDLVAQAFTDAWNACICPGIHVGDELHHVECPALGDIGRGKEGKLFIPGSQLG